MNKPSFGRAMSVFAVALSMTISIPLSVGAQQPMSKPQAQSQADNTAKVSMASGLVAYGEKNKDAYALLTAAKMLSQVGAKVEDPKAAQVGGKASEFDVGAILKKAKDYAGDNDALKKDISLAEKNMPQKWACYYAWACNYYYCNYVYYC